MLVGKYKCQQPQRVAHNVMLSALNLHLYAALAKIHAMRLNI